MRQARWPPCATAQGVFLVLFSYAFFFEGFTGLTITIGAVITLFVLMQMTAHVSWDDVFGGADAKLRRCPCHPWLKHRRHRASIT